MERDFLDSLSDFAVVEKKNKEAGIKICQSYNSKNSR